MSAHQKETICPPVTGGGCLCNIFCQCLLENMSCGISFWAAFSIFDTDHVACLSTVILAAVFVVLDDNNLSWLRISMRQWIVVFITLHYHAVLLFVSLCRCVYYCPCPALFPSLNTCTLPCIPKAEELCRLRKWQHWRVVQADSKGTVVRSL